MLACPMCHVAEPEVVERVTVIARETSAGDIVAVGNRVEWVSHGYTDTEVYETLDDNVYICQDCLYETDDPSEFDIDESELEDDLS